MRRVVIAGAAVVALAACFIKPDPPRTTGDGGPSGDGGPTGDGVTTTEAGGFDNPTLYSAAYRFVTCTTAP